MINFEIRSLLAVEEKSYPGSLWHSLQYPGIGGVDHAVNAVLQPRGSSRSSTVRAFVTRMSSGSLRKAAGLFQNAQCHPSHSLVTGRLMCPSRLRLAGLGSTRQPFSEPAR